MSFIHLDKSKRRVNKDKEEKEKREKNVQIEAMYTVYRYSPAL